MTLKPGNKALTSVKYGVVGSRGGKTSYEVAVVKDEPMPPTKKPGQSHLLVDPTKNKSGHTNK